MVGGVRTSVANAWAIGQAALMLVGVTLVGLLLVVPEPTLTVWWKIAFPCCRPRF